MSDPASPKEREQIGAVLGAVSRVIGGPRTLKEPPCLVLEALAQVTGMQAAVTGRTAAQLLELVDEGRAAADRLEGLPVPVLFGREQDPDRLLRLVQDLHLSVTLAAIELSNVGSPIASHNAISALAYLVGQVSALVLIERAELLALLQAGAEHPSTGPAKSLYELARGKPSFKGKRKRRARA